MRNGSPAGMHDGSPAGRTWIQDEVGERRSAAPRWDRRLGGAAAPHEPSQVKI
jgi:hypothetical protein